MPMSRISKLLLEAGSNVSERNSFGLIPHVGVALTNTNPEVIHALLQRGASLTVRDSVCADATIYSTLNPNPQALSLIADSGGNVINDADYQGQSLLMT